MVRVDQPAEPRIEGPPLAHVGRGMGHLTQPPKFRGSVATEAGNFGVFGLCQGFGLADQVGQAALPELNPLPIHPIAIADQHPRPILASARMDHEEGHLGPHHGPDPQKRPVSHPGGLIDVIDFGPTGYLPHGLEEPVDELLDRPLADGDAKHRTAEILNRSAAVALGACHLPDQCGEHLGP